MLGSRIAALRRNAGMSQAALAKRLCVTPSTVGMYEQGRRAPAYDTLIMLSKEFDVSLDYLLTGVIQSGNEFQTAAGLLLSAAQAQVTAEKLIFSVEPRSKDTVTLEIVLPLMGDNAVVY